MTNRKSFLGSAVLQRVRVAQGKEKDREERERGERSEGQANSGHCTKGSRTAAY
jgi:hypothetical protein